MIWLPGVVLSIDEQYNVELAREDFMYACFIQEVNATTTLDRLKKGIQWPLANDEVVIKLDFVVISSLFMYSMKHLWIPLMTIT